MMDQNLPTAVSRQPSAVGAPPRVVSRGQYYPRWLWIFSLVVMLVTTIPYMLGYASEGSEWQFTGFVFGVEDGNSYMAKMLRGANGDWLFRTPYTAWPQTGVLAFLPYLLLGKLTAPPGQHVQLVALFHLFRIGGGILYILASYDFLALFIKGERWRRWGVALVTLGGGMGWLLILLGRGSWFGSLPLDMFSPETFGFLSLYGLPHLALARALLLWGLCAYLSPSLAPWQNRSGLFTGILWLVMGLMQPLTVLLAWAIIGAHCGVLFLVRLWDKWKKEVVDWAGWRAWVGRLTRIVGITAPIVIYTAWAFNADPVLNQWTAQNLILSPHPLHYLAAYGLLIPFAILGVVYLLRDRREGHWLPVAWSLALPFLVYAPYPLQRRLAEGYWVVLVALALVFFDRSEVSSRNGGNEHGSLPYEKYRASAVSGTVFVFPRFIERIRRNGKRIIAFRWMLTMAFPTTLFLLIGGANAVRVPGIPIFRPRAEVAAFQILDDQANSDAVVLASYDTGNALPAWAPVFVVIGHGPESVGLAELTPRVARFYQVDSSDDERLGLLHEFNVDYVFWGPNEHRLGAWDPQKVEYLNLIFDYQDYKIFSVNLAGN